MYNDLIYAVMSQLGRTYAEALDYLANVLEEGEGE